MRGVSKGDTMVFAESDSTEKGRPTNIYVVKSANLKDTFANVRFQDGPVKESGINGAREEDILAILIDRIRSF